MSNIKSIKLNTYIFDSSSMQLPTQTFKDEVLKMINEYPDYFEIEYEPEKPKLLKRADGSLISEPKKGEEVWVIDKNFEVLVNFYESKRHLNLLQNGLVYLIEDDYHRCKNRKLAEKKAKMLTKQLEITVEIDRLNAEQQFIIDKNDYSKYQYYLNTDESGTVTYFAYHPKTPKNTQLLSAETTKTILAKYSQDELKQYLKIII